MATERRIDHLFQEMLNCHAVCVTTAMNISKLTKQFRRHAYRFAVKVLEVQRDWHNELVDLLKAKSKTVTQWMDEHFEVIEAMGESRVRLFAAIEGGMTEAQYVAKGCLWMLRRDKEDLVRRSEAVSTIPKNAEQMKPEEAARFWENKFEAEHALRVEWQKRCAQLEKTVERQNVVIRSVERKIAAVIGGAERKAV